MMKKGIKLVLTGAVIALITVAAFIFGFADSGRTGSNKVERKARRALLVQKGAQKNAVKKPEPPVVVARRERMLGKGVHAARGRIDGGCDQTFRDEDGKAYPEKDQKVMRKAQLVIEKDDLAEARKLASDALISSNVELRGMVVDALGWFGKDALAELLPFLSDRDEEVAENAKQQWMSGLQEIDDEAEKAGVVELAMTGLRDKDVLEDVSNELIGLDELASIQVLANVILDGGNSAAIAAAKETYNTITGENWSDIDAAEAWLQKNYEANDD